MLQVQKQPELFSQLQKPILLNITLSAIYLSISRQTIYRYIHAGKIKPIRFSSRNVKIPLTQLNELLEIK